MAAEPITIRVAHSPDSDDAFMFYALAQGKIPTDNRVYVHELSDIESLNQRALRGELEVTAVSIHAYAHLADKYALLSHGASMGDRYGPKVVALDPRPVDPRDGLKGRTVAVPGPLTSAYLALQLYQSDFQPVFVAFDEIVEAVKRQEVDAGLIIHESQLTYEREGLNLWVDMGEWWHDETALPLPLGGNVVRRDLGSDLIAKISTDLKASIVYALSNRAAALDHAMKYARGLVRSEADEFVGMYVNDFTVDYGETGRTAVREFLGRAADAGLVPSDVDVTFIDA
ncbi:MAG: MqnA/MqnD/SBP family protein [Gemmatimonadales bacterium]